MADNLAGEVDEYLPDGGCIVCVAFSVCYVEYGGVYILERCKVLCTVQIQSGLQLLSNLTSCLLQRMFVKRSLS